MLDQMLVTFIEGAVICLGVPFLLKLCAGIFGSWIIELDLRFWRCAVSNKRSSSKQAGDIVETEQVLRTDVFRCSQLQTEDSKSTALVQRHCGFVSNHTRNMQLKHLWCQNLISGEKLEKCHLEQSAPTLIHSVKGRGLENMSLPYSKLKDLYRHFNQDSIFSAYVQETPCGKISHDILKDKLGYSKNSQTAMKEDCKVQSFENTPGDICDMDELTSVRDCVFNKKGQLVRMFICFDDDEHSDTSSVASLSDSNCEILDSDCEDFIVFENSCTDGNQHCTKFDFVCQASELHKETSTKSVVLTSNLYCEVSMMASFDTKLDSFVQEILQPNLHYTCDEVTLNKNRSKEVRESCKNFVSKNTTDKTVSKDTKKKKVQFMPDHQLAVVHPMIVWNFAHKQARKGTWEADALDRLRFQKRVEELSEILTPVLLAKKEKAIQS